MRRSIVVLVAVILMAVFCSSTLRAQYPQRVCIYYCYIVIAGMYGDNTLHFYHREVTLNNEQDRQEVLAWIRDTPSKVGNDLRNAETQDGNSFYPDATAGMVPVPKNARYSSFIFDIDGSLKSPSAKMLPSDWYGRFKYVSKHDM